MLLRNIKLGEGCDIDPSSSINNVVIGNGVKIAKRCSIFGSPEHVLKIGANTYIGMSTTINGFSADVVIGKNVSIAQGVNVMSNSGPNASMEMQKYFPIIAGNVAIGDHSWVGANSVIMPNVRLGKFCVVAANSFVNSSFPPYSVIGGNPAQLLYKLGDKT
jgi:acetyltransferase-like isoleucine patch superfamily enzyme